MQAVARLEGIGLCKNFAVRGHTINVLKGVTLSVAAGETVVIRGRSGQGKTVLLWLLSGIDLPTAGEVRFEGKPFHQMKDEELAKLRRESIGLLFQNFNLINSWTARENVEAALVGGPDTPASRRTKADTLLGQMGLSDRLDNLPTELSIGQQQRVALARALINDPVLLLADEPTGNVDPEMAEELCSLLDRYVREKHASLIVATHGHYPGETRADRCLLLQDGRLHGEARQAQ